MEINELQALGDNLQPQNIPIEQILLDPNNPRFLDDRTPRIDDARIPDAAVQEIANTRLIESFGVEKLAASMRANGYLPIDRIVVKRLPTPANNYYVVLEGNRRVCAAKLLAGAIASDAAYASESVANSIRRIPCLEYLGGDADAAWIFQGLRHIAGISDWPAYNKAKLLVEQIQAEELTLTQAGERFGLSPFGAGQWARGYFAYQQAREESDYQHEIKVDAYPYFQELFGRSSAPMREWMEWDDERKRFQSLIKFNEFIAWLYPRDLENERPDERGDFERRHIRVRDDIRQLSYLICEEPDLFDKFRRELDVERVYAEAMARKYERATANNERSIFDTLQHGKRALENVSFRLMQNEEFKARLLIAVRELQATITDLGLE
jgi:hypothetical protein